MQLEQPRECAGGGSCGSEESQTRNLEHTVNDCAETIPTTCWYRGLTQADPLQYIFSSAQQYNNLTP